MINRTTDSQESSSASVSHFTGGSSAPRRAASEPWDQNTDHSTIQVIEALGTAYVCARSTVDHGQGQTVEGLETIIESPACRLSAVQLFAHSPSIQCLAIVSWHCSCSHFDSSGHLGFT